MASRARWIAGLSMALVFPALAQVRPSGESTAREVLEKHCTGCHGAAEMSGLDLRQRESILKGGKRGAAVVPGNPDQSLLYQAVVGSGELKMPPGKQKLSAAEIETLRSWIRDGARSDSEAAKKMEPSWWSFRQARRPAIPAVKRTDWVRNPIDAFVLHTLEEKGLAPTARTDKITLARRIYFDVTGLPPKPEEIDAFLADSSADAYSKLVDKLLASPRFGETWGRHWLDVVRYAESGGFETDIYFPNAWRYRDYVIQSFNEDKPYDRFIQEQMAADELWPDTLELEGSYYIPKEKQKHLEARIGTGLFTLGPVLHESALDGEFIRTERLADAVDVTGAAFLGLTIGCARCHDHKFDPITQKDYYRLSTVFLGSEAKEIPVVHEMSVFDYYQAYPKLIAVEQVKKAYERVGNQAKERIVARRLKKFSPEALAAEKLLKEKRTPQQQEMAVEVEAARGVGETELEKELTAEESAERHRLIVKLGEAALKAPTRYPTATVLGHSEIVPEGYLLNRGDYKNKGPKVGAGFPVALSDGKDIPDSPVRPFVPQRRKALALWLTSRSNPLTARVMVNRIWMWNFGRGIVGTPNDFGRQGDPPSHPELLDWLAVEFMENAWSVKSMVRLMLLSNSYQMSTANNEADVKIDPENRYLWRANRRRLEAEQLRDAILTAAGNINLKMGGPSVVPPLSKEEMAGMRDPSQWPVSSDPREYTRRSVYLYVKRAFRMPMLESFDMPET
ncbi:MAG TPA: PSD1 and planctomycete cytochrome C domain-containing protein, partial [Bryobacteraceae bacterium]|nr:PSD1 and planctomycete cytochrome C domain-containing protein [Bryobacteraceae bacterium]